MVIENDDKYLEWNFNHISFLANFRTKMFNNIFSYFNHYNS